MSELRILLVDDDAEQRALVRRLFASAGFTDIVEAGDGESAIEVAGSAQPGLVVLDLVMPGRSGFEVLPDIQDRAPGARIVVLSNLPRRTLGDPLRQRGAVGFIEKRVPPAELVEEILTAAAVTDVAVERMSVQLAASSAAARDARRFIREALGTEGSDLVESVELLTSELVTNAVVHASTAPRVAVRLTPAAVRIEVHDDDPAMPSPMPFDAHRPGGRGLFIIESLASRWGAEHTDSGKLMWFELDRSESA